MRSQYQPWTHLGSAALAAGAMYLLDPDRGRRRRALLRDQALHAARKTGDGMDALSRDARNRLRGTWACLRRRLDNRSVDDAVLVARVRSRLGGAVSHPSSIEVTADHGRVTLRGPILAEEVGRLVARVKAVPGVSSVENQLTVCERPGTVPGLQGRATRTGPRPEWEQEYWSPTMRLVTGASGSALAALAARRGGPVGLLTAVAGLGLLARAGTNLPFRRLVGVHAGRRAVEFHKILTIHAPVEEVFACWSHCERFPQFMAHVREVKGTPMGQSHWVVAGPLGTSVAWDAVVTAYETNRLLVWKTLPGALVAHAGIVRFEPTPDGRTRLNIRLSYNPPAGALGHLLAALGRADPKQAMDEDLVRLKSLLEYGKATAHGREVTRQELAEAPPPLRHVG